MSQQNQGTTASKLDQIETKTNEVPKLKMDQISRGKKKRIMTKRASEEVSEKSYMNLD